MSNNISSKTDSTIETLFQLNNEPEEEKNNLISNIEEISEYCQSINTDEIILPQIKPETITISSNNSKKNVLNKKRKNLFKRYKIEKLKKIKAKVGKQNYDNNKRIRGNNHQNSIYKSPKKYNEFDEINGSKLCDDKKFDKYGIQTFTEESQTISLTQIFSDNPDMSEDNSIIKEIVISPFNYKIFEKNESKYNSIKFDEPLFISIEYILKNFKKYIEKLWSKENQIFENENDFNITLKNGIIYQNVYKLLSENKKYHDKKRADEMINKIKTQLQESYLNYANSFDIMKYCEIYKPKKGLISNQIKSNFNLIYLTQELYNILSNDSSDTCNKTNKDKILEIKNQNFSFFQQHFCLTIQKCLNIFRYQEQNHHFKNKLVEFIIKEYTSIKGNDTEVKKDYIASLILLVYNFERFFYLRLPKKFKN
jgi:hypothetical protein